MSRIRSNNPVLKYVVWDIFRARRGQELETDATDRSSLVPLKIELVTGIAVRPMHRRHNLYEMGS
jgi:hypothetical protein